jgi:hypothetical protein
LREVAGALERGGHGDGIGHGAGAIVLVLQVEREEDSLLRADKAGDSQRTAQHESAARIGV